MPLNNFYVYGYFDPITRILRYVGKGRRDRYITHLQRAKRGNYKIENKKLDHWLKTLIANKSEPIILKLAQRLSESEAFDLEKKLIEVNQSVWLLNKKKGGTN